MSGNVLIMPRRVNADDLLFASVRARYFESPQEVASDLQHAAEHPERLDGVTPYQALAEAGELLTVAGRHAEAVRVLRRAVAAAQESHDTGIRISLASALARAGGTVAPEDPAPGAPASPLPGAPPGSAPGPGADQGPDVGFGTRLTAALAAENGDQLAQARRRAGAAIEHAPRSALRHRLAQLALERERELDQAAREQVRAGPGHGAARPATTGGRAPFSWPGGVAPGSHFFPAQAGDAVLWWPDPHYQRLMRQLPELAPALGWPWPQHVANAENTLRSIAATGRGTGWLMPADFGQFVGYLKQTSADPRAAEVLRGYAAHAVVAGTPTPWPPRPRNPCWCGSDRRYRDCCRAGPAGQGTGRA
jgi:hypothetical protein